MESIIYGNVSLSLGVLNIEYTFPCYVGPCHHGMARSQAADEGDDPQVHGRVEIFRDDCNR
jgi:hypothetical protein